jgi:monoterpene epsilon-lactone hydrolase
MEGLVDSNPERARKALGRRGLVVMTSLWLMAVPVAAEAPVAGQVVVDGQGTARGQISVPPSEYLSPTARAALVARLQAPPPPPLTGLDFIAAVRKADDAMASKVVAQWQTIYPARIDPALIGGVKADVVTPIVGVPARNAHRVLINLHGGGFFAGAGAGGQAEAMPVAGRGRIKVVAVDYRLAPEHRYPAASEDVERVYVALLKDYRPENIGIYGCSAGGALVAQATAWLQHRHLPRPGAIGIFCSGAMPGFWSSGDSFMTTPIMNGRAQVTQDEVRDDPALGYLSTADQNDPLVVPGLSRVTLAQFPPTLLVTGTRDTAMSNVLVTNARLLAAGVQTQLFVQEGLGHGEFTLIPGTPEATQAYDVIWNFFDRHLGNVPKRAKH